MGAPNIKEQPIHKVAKEIKERVLKSMPLVDLRRSKYFLINLCWFCLILSIAKMKLIIMRSERQMAQGSYILLLPCVPWIH